MTDSTTAVEATVKWFNPTKGFGFVTADDNRPDALLHASVLAQMGKRWLAEGTRVRVYLDEGPRGLVVSEVLHIEESEEERASVQSSLAEASWLSVEVKFFNFAKGYGFAQLINEQDDEEGKDVFFDSRVLAQADMDPPRPGDRFEVALADRPQGLAAAMIREL